MKNCQWKGQRVGGCVCAHIPEEADSVRICHSINYSFLSFIISLFFWMPTIWGCYSWHSFLFFTSFIYTDNTTKYDLIKDKDKTTSNWWNIYTVKFLTQLTRLNFWENSKPAGALEVNSLQNWSRTIDRTWIVNVDLSKSAKNSIMTEAALLSQIASHGIFSSLSMKFVNITSKRFLLLTALED